MSRAGRSPSIKSVMSPFPWFARAGDELASAISLMNEHRIRHLPVTDEGELVGIVSERDVRLLESLTSEEQRAGLRVRDATTFDPYIVEIDEPLDAVLLEMARRHIGSAIIVRQQKLAGILTTTDVCRAFGELLETLHPDPPPDEVA